LVRLVYQPHGSRPVVHTNRWRRTPPPVVECIAHCDEIGRGEVGAGEGLVPLGSGELHDPVLHCEDGVAAGDLPLTVSADTREAISDLDRAENAARGTEHYRGVVLDPTFVCAPAKLSANDLRRLLGQVEKHVQPVATQVAKTAAAGLGGIEHPGAIPGFVACRPWTVDPDIDVRQRAETLCGEQFAGARGEGR